MSSKFDYDNYSYNYDSFREFLNKLKKKSKTQIKKILDDVLESIYFHRDCELPIILISEYDFELDLDEMLQFSINVNNHCLYTTLIKKGVRPKNINFTYVSNLDPKIVKSLINDFPEMLMNEKNEKFLMKISLKSADILELVIKKNIVDDHVINSIMISAIESERLDLINIIFRLAKKSIEWNDDLLLKTIATKETNIIKFVLEKADFDKSTSSLKYSQKQMYDLLSKYDFDSDFLLKLLVKLLVKY